MQILAALVLCLALVLAPYTVKVELGADAGIPWKTFSESVKDARTAGPGMCRVGAGAEEILTAVFEKGGVTYLYFAAESGRWAFAELGSDGKPVRIYTGKQLPSPDHDVIKVTESHAFDPDGRDAGGPCRVLFPDSA